MKKQYIVIKEHDDYASRLRLGDVIWLDYSILFLDNDLIENIGGAHYLKNEFDNYFKEVK